MRVQPFSYIKEPVGEAPPQPSGAPFIDDMVFWFKDVNNNNDGTNWTDSSNLGVTKAFPLNGALIDGTNNRVVSDNSTNSSGGAREALRIRPTGQDINVQSALILFNQPFTTGRSGTSRAYFYDARDANNESPDNAGYFNQADSVATHSTGIHGGDATFFAYSPPNGFIDGGSITTQLLTDGRNNATGGNDWYQWMGPNGRGINNTKRAFFFNYNSNRDILITTNNEGWYLGGNDNPTEGSSFGWYEVIGYNRQLTYNEFQQLITYLQGTGVIT